MGTSLGFHIVFAVLGVGLPLLMFVAEGLWLWRRDPGWLELARRWSKAFGILFALSLYVMHTMERAEQRAKGADLEPTPTPA